MNLGLRYGWYIKGPYSTDVSHAAYRLQSIFDDVRLNKILPSFSRGEKEKASRSRRLFEAIDKLGRDKAYWYELVASVAFLRVSNHLTDRGISSFLRDVKPGMKKKDVRKAIEVLNDFERE